MIFIIYRLFTIQLFYCGFLLITIYTYIQRLSLQRQVNSQRVAFPVAYAAIKFTHIKTKKRNDNIF